MDDRRIAEIAEENTATYANELVRHIAMSSIKDAIKQALQEQAHEWARIGLVSVPDFATADMLAAGLLAYEKNAATAGMHVQKIYRAMIEAA